MPVDQLKQENLINAAKTSMSSKILVRKRQRVFCIVFSSMDGCVVRAWERMGAACMLHMDPSIDQPRKPNTPNKPKQIQITTTIIVPPSQSPNPPNNPHHRHIQGPESEFFAKLAVDAVLSVRTESEASDSGKKVTKYPVRCVLLRWVMCIRNV